jgi:hypothetical protein
LPTTTAEGTLEFCSELARLKGFERLTQVGESQTLSLMAKGRPSRGRLVSATERIDYRAIDEIEEDARELKRVLYFGPMPHIIEYFYFRIRQESQDTVRVGLCRRVTTIPESPDGKTWFRATGRTTEGRSWVRKYMPADAMQ